MQKVNHNYGGLNLLGYVKAFKPDMKIRDFELYQGVYCSLCRALGRNYSPIAQLFLSYDFAFAAILRLSAAENGCTFLRKHCPYNPAKKCSVCSSKQELDYCSHAVIILTYYKIVDNLHDAGLKSKITACLLYPIVRLMHKKAARLAPEAEKAVAEAMERQKEAEVDPSCCIDAAAHPSADALGKIISFGFDGNKKESLYSLGYMVGRYVYILDAADDLRSDLKSGNFNPFRAEYSDIDNEKCRNAFIKRAREMLNLTQSSALEALDSVEKKRFEDILENIVLDGLTNSSENALKKYLPQAKKKTYFTVD